MVYTKSKIIVHFITSKLYTESVYRKHLPPILTAAVRSAVFFLFSAFKYSAGDFVIGESSTDETGGTRARCVLRFFLEYFYGPVDIRLKRPTKTRFFFLFLCGFCFGRNENGLYARLVNGTHRDNAEPGSGGVSFNEPDTIIESRGGTTGQ